jgi:hypothetical protein
MLNTSYALFNLTIIIAFDITDPELFSRRERSDFYWSIINMFIFSVVETCVIVSNILGSFFFVVLGFELRTFTLSHSTSPILVKGFSR